MIDENQLTSINKITKNIWLILTVLGAIASVVVYFKYGTENIGSYIGITFISAMMYGWKRFQLAKFGPKKDQ